MDTHYDDRSSLASKVNDLLTLGGTGPKPVWITEQASNTVADRSLAAAATQAAQKIQAMVEAYAANPDKLLLWGDIDQHPTLWFWGNLKAEDHTVRSAFFAFATLIRQLTQSRCEEVYAETPDWHGYRFADTAGHQTLVAWSAADTALALEGITGPVNQVDLMGVTTPLAPSGGTLLAAIGTEPIYLCLTQIPTRVRNVATFSEFGIFGIAGRPDGFGTVPHQYELG